MKAHDGTQNWLMEHWDEPADVVGGDFVLVHRDSNLVRVVVADATGHGAEAVALASEARAIIARDLVRPVELETIRAWSREIHSWNRCGFVCCTYIEVDVRNRRASIANAGNPPLLVARGGAQKIEAHRSTGMPLGLVEPDLWLTPTMVGFALAPEDTMVCFTDGLIDRLDQHRRRFGLGRVISSIRTGVRASPLDALGDRVARFADSRAEQDDLTVLAIRLGDQQPPE